MKIAVLLLFLTNILFAQIKTITLNEVILTALENNKQNKISKLAVQIADAQYKQALSANYPIIKAMLLGQREKENTEFQMKGNILLPQNITTLFQGINPNIKNTLEIDTEVTAKGRDTAKGLLKFTYPLYTGGKITSIINQAQLNKLLVSNTQRRDELTVVFDAKKYFYAYVLSNELYNLANETLERMKYISDLTKTFYESGESLNVKKTDYLSVQLTVALLESLVSKIEKNKFLVKSALINVMGLSWNSDINPSYNNEKLLPVNYMLNSLVEEAYSNNSDIRKLDIALKVNNEQIKEKESGHYPNLAFLGEVSHTYNSYKYGILNDDQENSWNIGFVANLPLFDGFKTTNSIHEKKIEKKKMYLFQDMIKETVAMQIKNELTNALLGFKQIKTLKKAKNLAKENRKLNIRAYQIDAIEAKDVVQAQYIEAYVKADYLKYVHDYLISLAKIDNLLGREFK